MHKNKQLSSTILLIRPAAFGFNEMTAGNNAFQKDDGAVSTDEIRQRALEEFEALASILQANGLNVIIMDDQMEPLTPDAVFPNNWISFHQSGKIVLYPMFAPNRRLERRDDIVDFFLEREPETEVFDMSFFESNGKFLEGTGSMVLDRENQIAYACASVRTDPDLFNMFCEKLDYQGILFHATDGEKDIYHTNVMMAIGEGFAVICLDSIPDEQEKKSVRESLENSGHEIIDITIAQLEQFAGNMLQVRNQQGQPLLVMSRRAERSLNPEQIEQLKKYSIILIAPLDVIETYGGGSVRCMMAEVF